MDFELAEQVVLITGGSDGLGRALADLLTTEGASVAICGRSQERLDETANSLSANPGEILPMRADVTKPEDMQALYDAVEKRWGRLSGLVNNAGIHTGKPFKDAEDDYWQADFELKLLAAIRGSRMALPLFARNGGGSIVNALSIYAKFQPARSMPSSVYRSAGLAMTNGMSKEVAADGVRVNAILTGFIESGQWVRGAAEAGLSVEEFIEKRVKALGIPMNRAGRAQEFADVAAFLLSPRSSYVTGTAINVDGGLSPVI